MDILHFCISRFFVATTMAQSIFRIHWLNGKKRRGCGKNEQRIGLFGSG